MPRPARLFAALLLAVAVSSTGIAAASADPPSARHHHSTSSPSHGHDKHAGHRKSTRKSVHRHVGKSTTSKKTSTGSKSSSKPNANGHAQPSSAPGAQPDAATPGLITGLVSALVRTGGVVTGADGGQASSSTVSTRPGGGSTVGGTTPSGVSASGPGAGSKVGPRGATKHQPPSRSTSSTSPNVPYQAIDRPEPRTSAVLIALITVFVVVLAGMVVGAGYRGRRNAA